MRDTLHTGSSVVVVFSNRTLPFRVLAEKFLPVASNQCIERLLIIAPGGSQQSTLGLLVFAVHGEPRVDSTSPTGSHAL
jgi:hypothetical protein